jgi:hypothetical protein
LLENIEAAELETYSDSWWDVSVSDKPVEDRRKILGGVQTSQPSVADVFGSGTFTLTNVTFSYNSGIIIRVRSSSSATMAGVKFRSNSLSKGSVPVLVMENSTLTVRISPNLHHMQFQVLITL